MMMRMKRRSNSRVFPGGDRSLFIFGVPVLVKVNRTAGCVWAGRGDAVLPDADAVFSHRLLLYFLQVIYADTLFARAQSHEANSPDENLEAERQTDRRWGAGVKMRWWRRCALELETLTHLVQPHLWSGPVAASHPRVSPVLWRVPFKRIYNFLLWEWTGIGKRKQARFFFNKHSSWDSTALAVLTRPDRNPSVSLIPAGDKHVTLSQNHSTFYTGPPFLRDALM